MDHKSSIRICIEGSTFFLGSAHWKLPGFGKKLFLCKSQFEKFLRIPPKSNGIYLLTLNSLAACNKTQLKFVL